MTPRPWLLECYRLRWDLTDVPLFVAQFSAPHSDTPDTAKSLADLRGILARLASTA